MKKILITAAAIVALTSCSKEETMDLGNSNVIQFANLNNRPTRAANDASSSYQVYAKWTGSTSGWYINDVINGMTNDPQGGTHYWPTTGTVDFYSWAPATVTAATSTYPDLSITYTVPAGANEDFTIAEPILNATKASTGVVNFQFAHMLSKVTISVDLTDELKSAGYSVSFTGGTASLLVNATTATINPMITPFSWGARSGVQTTYTGSATSGSVPFMIMPQNSIGCEIQVLSGVVITKDVNTAVYNGGLSTYTIAASDIQTDAFVPGKLYNVKLIISDLSTDPGGENIFGDQIIFSADVNTWTTGSDIPLTQP